MYTSCEAQLRLFTVQYYHIRAVERATFHGTATTLSPHLPVNPSTPHLHAGSAPNYATKHLKRMNNDWLKVGTLGI
jgi:hypothetical protein